MDLIEPIREALVPVLTVGSWYQIRKDHDRVELPWRGDLEPGWGKPRYVERVLLSLDEAAVLTLARRCIDAFPDRAGLTVQDALWRHEAGGQIELSAITRRSLADWFDGKRLHPDEQPTTFLGRFAKYSAIGFPAVSYASDGRLVQGGAFGAEFYAIYEPEEPITHYQLLDQYGFRTWPDQRVILMLEALVHPTTRNGAEQRAWVDGINGIIAVDGYQLRETQRISGQPVFAVRRQRSSIHRRPKNLIFSSNGPKPELGFSDAIDNDVVILTNAEHCLVYEDPIDDDGLTWPTLVAWWAREHGLDEATARKNLGKRLLASTGSPPERRFFRAYFKRYSPMLETRLPALLPQVYLHYDPATLRQLQERGLERRFLVQRMDFLLLLPAGVRVVLEVDGQQHYATNIEEDARPSPKVYAETMRSDRELRLAGYEVYRFGNAELTEDGAPGTVEAFFDALFSRHRVAR